MVEYKNGKVYKLVCNVTGLVYVGSTTQPLSVRKAEHVRTFKRYQLGKTHYVTSFKIIESGDFDIVLVEEVECENKEQLHRKEREWIEKLDCVNKVVPTRTKAEYYQANQGTIKAKSNHYYYAHHEENKAKHKKYNVEYRRAHPEKHEEYYEKNRNRILEYHKEYREQNRDRIIKWNKERLLCPCGIEHCRAAKSQHQRSAKHRQWQERVSMEQEDKAYLPYNI